MEVQPAYLFQPCSGARHPCARAIAYINTLILGNRNPDFHYQWAFNFENVGNPLKIQSFIIDCNVLKCWIILALLLWDKAWQTWIFGLLVLSKCFARLGISYKIPSTSPPTCIQLAISNFLIWRINDVHSFPRATPQNFCWVIRNGGVFQFHWPKTLDFYGFLTCSYIFPRIWVFIKAFKQDMHNRSWNGSGTPITSTKCSWPCPSPMRPVVIMERWSQENGKNCRKWWISMVLIPWNLGLSCTSSPDPIVGIIYIYIQKKKKKI